jgi:hypothetical protein
MSGDMSTYGLPAAILNFFQLPFTPLNIHTSAIEFLYPENVGIAVGTALLPGLEAEI